MGKIPIYVVGAGLVLLGAVGTFNAYADLGQAAKENSDLTTTGVVTSLTGTELRHAVGVTLDTTYKMQYSFVAEDGKTYFDDETLDQAEFASLREGQAINVQYNSTNPSICASTYGNYFSVNDMPSASPMTRFWVCLGVFGGGIAIILCGLFIIKNDDPVQNASQSTATGFRKTSAYG